MLIAQLGWSLHLSKIWVWIQEHSKIVTAIFFWIIVLLILRQYMQSNDLSFEDITNQLRSILTDTWYGPLLYIIIYLVRPLILFPASLLTLLGGSVFGLFPGFFIVLIGGTLSSIIPFGVGKSLTGDGSDDVEKTGRLQKFVTMLQENPFQAVLIMRLLYLPYDAVSLLAGSLRISFLVFLLATLIGNIGGTLAYVGLGASIQGNITTGDISIDSNTLLFSLVVLILGLGISRLLSRFNIGQKKNEDLTK